MVFLEFSDGLWYSIPHDFVCGISWNGNHQSSVNKLRKVNHKIHDPSLALSHRGYRTRLIGYWARSFFSKTHANIMDSTSIVGSDHYRRWFNFYHWGRSYSGGVMVLIVTCFSLVERRGPTLESEWIRSITLKSEMSQFGRKSTHGLSWVRRYHRRWCMGYTSILLSAAYERSELVHTRIFQRCYR